MGHHAGCTHKASLADSLISSINNLPAVGLSSPFPSHCLKGSSGAARVFAAADVAKASPKNLLRFHPRQYIKMSSLFSDICHFLLSMHINLPSASSPREPGLLQFPKGWSPSGQLAQQTEHRATEDYSEPLKPNRICPAGLRACLGPVTPFSTQFVHFRI